MKTVLFTDESRASPNDTGGLTIGWVFNGDNYAMGIRRQQSCSVVMIWGGMIGNELTIASCKIFSTSHIARGIIKLIAWTISFLDERLDFEIMRVI